MCVKSSLVDALSNELSVKISVAFWRGREIVKLISDKCMDDDRDSLHVKAVLDVKLHGPSDSRTKMEMNLKFLQNTFQYNKYYFYPNYCHLCYFITNMKKHVSF